MNLMPQLAARVSSDGPVKAGLIGAGKFGSMFLSQVPTIDGLEVAAIVDVDVDRAREACRGVGWDDARIERTRFADTLAAVLDDDIDVLIEATGNPAAGIGYALDAIAARKAIVMVNVEADVLAGPLIARKASEAGVVYSMAYGDQPALIAELVDWARATGFRVTAAGKGTKYLPAYHQVTPADVWSHYGLTAEEAQEAGMNPQMFNSFLDGTKSALEMAAVANACELAVPEDGLKFPSCGVHDLPEILRPRSAGGLLEKDGMVEVVSSLERDGRPVFRDLRWGVYVVIEAPNDYAAACFKQYGVRANSSGRYAALYRPYHMIGLEVSVSVLNAALNNQPTGATRDWRGDVAAVAKRDLAAGETLDGEGGFTVYGKLIPSERSLREGALPIGLADGARLLQPVPAGAIVKAADVDLKDAPAVAVRREMEADARQTMA